MRYINAKMLERMNACPHSAKRFREDFGDRNVAITETICIRYAHLYSFAWLAAKMERSLSGDLLAVFVARRKRLDDHFYAARIKAERRYRTSGTVDEAYRRWLKSDAMARAIRDIEYAALVADYWQHIKRIR